MSDMLYLSGLKPKAVQETRVTAGWTVMVGSNGNRSRIGNAALVREDADFLFASFLIGTKPLAGSRLSSDYFYRWLMTEQVQAYLSASAEGTTGLNNLSHSFFRAMAIPVPPPDEQAAIARILDAVDTALERTRAAIERAREVKRALAQQLFARGVRGESQRKTVIGEIPKSWEILPVSAVVTGFQYGLSLPMHTKGRLPILRMGDIQDGDVRLDDLKFVTLPNQVVAPYRLRRGDVLFNRTNSQEWVGKVGIYRHDRDVVFASYLIRLLPDSTKVDGYYLGHVLNSYQAQCRIKRYATPGVQQVNINATNLGKVLIPVPAGPDGMVEQREIGRILEAAHAAERSYEPVLVAQQALKKSLMHDLLAGRVRVNHAKVAAS